MLGLRDVKMRERLLRINDLTLEKAIDICKESEQTSAQLQAMQSGTHDVVSFVRKRQTRDEVSRPTNRTHKKDEYAEESYSSRATRLQVLWASERATRMPCLWANLSKVWKEEPLFRRMYTRTKKCSSSVSSETNHRRR